MKDKVLIIIVTYNWEKWVKNVSNCLNSSKVKVDTIIIDNWSTDKTLELFEKNIKNIVKIVKNKKNFWFWYANNIWFEYALEHNYDYVYLLNQDARFFNDTIENLIIQCKKNPNTWIISPFQCSAWLKNVDKNFQINVCWYESNKEIFSDMYFNKLKESYEVTWVMAAHRMIPIDVIKKVWWFSPTFFHYWEDDNYTNRVKYFWYKILITPNINVVHDRYNRIDSNSKKFQLWYTYSLNLLSNPLSNSIKNFFMVFLINFQNIFRYKSLKPIYYIFKIIINYHQIKKNKKISMQTESAFLKIGKQ